MFRGVAMTGFPDRPIMPPELRPVDALGLWDTLRMCAGLVILCLAMRVMPRSRLANGLLGGMLPAALEEQRRMQARR